jgi:iron complex outermembrane receptor protein
MEISGNWKQEIGPDAPGWKWGVTGRYQYAKTTNVAVYGGSEDVLDKQLPYTPNHSAGAAIKIESTWFSAAYLHQWTGKQFTTSDNLDVLDGFSTGNLLLRYVLRAAAPATRNMQACFDFRLENIWNTPYQIIAYRPMPGRAFRIGLTLGW